MRIHGISLRNFRGVEAVDVPFEVDGVTIVEGRNEIGKSTLADAFDLLLNVKDSSTKGAVRDAKPIGRDVGPFVEADLSVGQYRMTYRKQWIRGKKTELHISAPAPEQLTGDQAHERMAEILEEETDTSLFSALRYHQGKEISQAEVGDSSTLAAALDAASGGSGSGGGDGADALFAKVEAERLKYVTKTGQPIGERKNKVEQLGNLSEKVSEIESELHGLEEAVNRHRQIDGELEELEVKSEELGVRIKQEQEVVQAVETVERTVETARQAKESAAAALQVAESLLSVRKSLVNSAEEAARHQASLEKEISAAAPGLESAMQAAKEAAAARDKAQKELESAEEGAAEARKLVELLDLRLDRDQLKERNERVIVAGKTIDDAERFLARCTVDDELLKKINKATERLAVALAQAEADNPRLKVEALAEAVHVDLSGKKVDVTKDSPLEETVSSEVSVSINDVARVTVARQRVDGDADEELKRASEEQEALLKTAGASSPEEAGELVRERAKHEADRDNAVKRRDDDLRDLEPAALAAKVERAEERLEQLESEFKSDGLGETTLEAARSALEEAEAKVAPAKDAFQDLQTSVDGSESKLRVLQDSNIQQQTQLTTAQQDVERISSELDEARKSAADTQLAEAVAKATELAAKSSEDLDAAELELKDGDPDSARAVLKNSLELKDDLTGMIHDREMEKVQIATELEIGGRNGLADRLAEALAAREELQQSVDAENRRADAANRLYEVLRAKREEAQQAYVRPFRDKLNSYCRILYGPDAQVDVDHSTLQIATLTREGTPIPFDQLSGGVREQLAVLARLACAALVSPGSEDGDLRGVPVIIDDALGYSDSIRLEKLGAAISVAGGDCQVIVLTCEPGRYSGVGKAKRISLDEAVQSASAEEPHSDIEAPSLSDEEPSDEALGAA